MDAEHVGSAALKESLRRLYADNAKLDALQSVNKQHAFKTLLFCFAFFHLVLRAKFCCLG